MAPEEIGPPFPPPPLSRDEEDSARGEVCNGLAGVAESRVVQGFVLCHSKLTVGGKEKTARINLGGTA